MLNEITGNVWKLLDRDSAVCILTNNTIYSWYDPLRASYFIGNIMGAGIALEACTRNEELKLKKLMVSKIRNDEIEICRDIQSQAMMLRFPTKDQAYENSTLDIIRDSLIKLKKYAEDNPNITVYLPRPGCGLGGLDWEKEVKSLCEEIIDNIKNIWIITF